MAARRSTNRGGRRARPRTARTTRRSTTVTNKFITVGILGRSTEVKPLSSDTTAAELAQKMGIEYQKVEVSSKTDGTGWKEVNADTKINGYKAILFTPGVDGGRY